MALFEAISNTQKLPVTPAAAVLHDMPSSQKLRTKEELQQDYEEYFRK